MEAKVGSLAFLFLYLIGGSFSFASSVDGSWPGWTPIAGSNMMPGQYNTLGIEQNEDGDFEVYLNNKEVGVIENENLSNITKVLIASDTAAGTAGSLHIDNVIIGDPDNAPPKAVEPTSKLATSWGKLKKL